jgi:putative lipoic acid-binding regulatory protein
MSKNKRTIKLNVTELLEADVNYISLVKRGANQVPFKVLKSDNTLEGISMINLGLGNLFTAKKSDNTAKIVSVIVKSNDIELLKPQIIEAGYKVDDFEEAEGLVIFKQDGYISEGDVTIIKVNEDIACTVTNVAKSFCPYDSGLSFMDKVSSQGFMPSVGIGVNALHDSMYDALYSEGDKDAVVTSITKHLSDFSDYVTTLAKDIPVAVFKMEKITLKNAKKVIAASNKVVEKAGHKKCGEGQTMVDGVCVDKPKAKKESVIKDDISNLEGLKELSTSVITLSGIVSGLVDTVSKSQKINKESIDSLAAKLLLVEGIATKADEAVRGTIVIGAAGDQEGLKPVLKTTPVEGDDGFWDGALELKV